MNLYIFIFYIFLPFCALRFFYDSATNSNLYYYIKTRQSHLRLCRQRVDKVDTLTDKRKWTQTRNHEAGSTFGTAMSDDEVSKVPKIQAFGKYAKSYINEKILQQWF